ncbi:maleylpyruvate isomerase family mycothiol-dependent enzyme [Kitasatospora sp. LaBMicrA B282]|uniref:maleylpyruvate isomerase family mycothiol-dependent enzyme n=1 Tax=Kitasatospora sp. LaBMicrA B282 TaxID=3420949 RepID=UPI003D0C6A9C
MPDGRPVPAIPALLAELAGSGARLAATLAGLPDPVLREPSALAGWSRGHVVSHLVRSADAYLWLLAAAHPGTDPGPRPAGAELARATEEGARLPATELTAELRERLARLTAAAGEFPPAQWETLVTALAGWRQPAWFTLYRCWRELETHHVDLDLGYGPADWPVRYVAWALDGTLTALATRDLPLARVEAVDLGRSWPLAPAGRTVAGPGHALLGWLSGRTDGTDLTADGPLPPLPAWPLPPAPGWG